MTADGAAEKRLNCPVILACPHCRTKIAVRTNQVTVVVPPDGPAVMTTTCTACPNTAWVRLDPGVLAHFAITDAVIVTIPADDHPDGPPITWDDVLDVHAQLDALPTAAPGGAA